ncbi:MAG TPA: hypothetical protein VLB85_13295 [Acidimicrobiia bacterium]|nr:hypothetical protein [Acidimicrobiia bacterium]
MAEFPGEETLHMGEDLQRLGLLRHRVDRRAGIFTGRAAGTCPEQDSHAAITAHRQG